MLFGLIVEPLGAFVIAADGEPVQGHTHRYRIRQTAFVEADVSVVPAEIRGRIIGRRCVRLSFPKNIGI